MQFHKLNQKQLCFLNETKVTQFPFTETDCYLTASGYCESQFLCLTSRWMFDILVFEYPRCNLITVSGTFCPRLPISVIIRFKCCFILGVMLFLLTQTLHMFRPA